MKRNSVDYVARELRETHYKVEAPPAKINTLLSNLLEKEEEIAVYKERLKELETAFYYNLEVISERDLELSVLEKHLRNKSEQLQQAIQEKEDLEDIIKTIDDKNCRKIQQLETRLKLKEDEIRELERENISNVTSLKKILDDVKQQQERKIFKITTKFETQKNQIIKGYREEIEEKEKYYLLEIDSLTGKLQEALKEKSQFMEVEEENINLRYRMADMERVFKEKEKYYLEELKMNKSIIRVSQEVQCKKEQVVEKKIQAEPENDDAECQTIEEISESEECFRKKILFLQEQNEVLKWVIKDLKKNRNLEMQIEDDQTPQEPKCVECAAVKTEVREVNRKFESEINILKKTLHEEQMQRAEEESIIQSLETSVISLKDKLLMGLQQKLGDFSGDDICSYTYNREIQNEIQVSLLEEKLSKKIDILMSTAEEERQKVNEKLEEFKKECVEKIDKFLQPREDSSEMKSENLLEKIRMEIHKLENKIESDMKNMVRNNCERDKCDKNFQTRIESKPVVASTRQGLIFPQTKFEEPETPRDPPRVYYRNDISMPEKCISVFRAAKDSVKCQNQIYRNRMREPKGFRKLTNDLVMSR